MVVDQATRLRQLARTVGLRSATPRVVIVRGASPGCGATTVAKHLATALCRRGVRIALVDAPAQSESVPPAAFHQAVGSPSDILTEADPADLLALVRVSIHSSIGQTLVERMQERRAQFDETDAVPTFLVDTGSSPEIFGQCCDVADEWLLVTRSDPPSVLSCYAEVKRIAQGSPAPIRVVFNRVDQAATAHRVFHGLAQVCRHFLDRHVGYDGWLPEEVPILPAVPRPNPADTPFARAIESLAARWMPRLEPLQDSEPTCKDLPKG